MALLLGLFVGSTLCGHSEPPMPPQPPQPPQPVAGRVAKPLYPLRWSWLHWWEANRMRFLQTLRQSGGQDLDPKQLTELRRQALAALTDSLDHVHGELRRAAALAIGRLESADQTERIGQHADQDVVESVRRAAIIALGLIDSADLDGLLRKVRYDNAAVRRAGLMTYGLGGTLAQPSRNDLRRVLVETDAADATAAGWSLSRHVHEENRKFFDHVLNTRESPWLASEALLALGQYGDPEAAGVLRRVVTTHERDIRKSSLRQLAAWDALVRQAAKTQGAINKAGQMGNDAAKGYDNYVKAHQEFYKNDPNPPPIQEKRQVGSVTVRTGLERIYLARLRASAAIGLTRIDEPATVTALLQLLLERDDEYNVLPKGFAIMALGELGAESALGKLLEILSDRAPRGHLKRQEDLQSPLRGFAALALGLYSQPLATPQGPADRAGFDQAMAQLIERLADEREKLEVRAACALALGLARRSSAIKPMVQISAQMDARDELLIGYVILGRGVLGDGGILEPAARFLAPGNDKTDLSGTLARRAAVLGLGLLGASESVPLLVETWHLNYYVSREVVVALALCNAYNTGEPMIERLSKSPNAAERVFMAEALGQLLSIERPSRLDGFAAWTNYTFKNESRRPFQRMANVFLFDNLIPSFGVSNWY